MAGIVIYKGLTEQQKVFVDLLGDGLPAKLAAQQAGYTTTRAVQELLANPHVVDAVHILVARSIVGEILPLAISTLKHLLTANGVSDRVRLDAAKAALDRAGFPAMRPAETKAPDKELAEMSMDDLRRILEETEAAIAAKAKPVNQATEAQDPDMFD